MKIQLGAGTEILPGYINTDIVDLPGIDRILNVMDFPWPFDDECAEEILALDLIEHLPTHTNEYESSIIKFIEEAYRILKPNGLLHMRTPGWKADFLYIDPTHVRGYDIRSFDFFDSNTDFGKAQVFTAHANLKLLLKNLITIILTLSCIR